MTAKVELSLQSYLGVVETLALYGRLLDDGQFDAWLELFTPECHLSMRGKQYVGRKGLTDFLSQRPAGPVKHMMSMPVISALSADRCAAATDFMALRKGEGGDIKITGTGRFNDQLHLIGSSWRIAEKIVTPSIGF